MRTLMILISLMAVPCCFAQQRELPVSEMKRLLKNSTYQGTYHPAADVVGYCLLNHPQELDKSYLRVTYDISVLVDTLSDKRVRDRMTALIGNKYYKFYSQFCWQLCMNHTVILSREESKAASEWMKSYDGTIINASVYRDRVKRTIRNRSLLPFINKIVFQYDEPQPRFEWTMTNETRTLEGYLCTKAQTQYAGRKWIVWFTTDIPIDGGLWKFSDLPGLILEAYDTQEHYHFTMTGIEQKAEPIEIYKTPTKIYDREKYRKFELTAYASPVLAKSGPEGYLVISFEDGHTELITAEDDMSLPYNPIELE